MPTLYRTYRPRDFSEILGQNYIKTILQNEILTGKISHAYLFCGPRAVGKTTMARVFAKAVNCLNRKENESEPCNECENCVNINAGRNLDIVEIDAASNTGVDNVRENIISASRVGSNQNKFKVFIIDEVHMLSISAFNALLKVLEEPPAHVIFILCTTEIHKVPATIISRCQRFDFKRISVADMVKKLERIVKAENIKVEKGILESIARHADGYLRDAESLLGQIISIGGDSLTQEEADLVIPHSDFNEIINLVEYLIKKDSAKAIKLINNLVDNGVSLKNFVTDLIEVLRKIMLAKINPALAESLGLDFGEVLEMKINTLMDNLSLPQLIRYVERFNGVNNELKNNFIIQLPMELAIIDLCLSETPVEAIRHFAPVQNIYTPVAKLDNSMKPDNSISGVAKTGGAGPASGPADGSNSHPASGHSPANISLEEVSAKWPEVLLQVKSLNHSLSFVLQACEISGLNGSSLVLTFKYKFHKDRVSETKIRTFLEKVLADVYGLSLGIETLIDENLELRAFSGNKVADMDGAAADIDGTENNAPDGHSDNKLINNILETFGGEVMP